MAAPRGQLVRERVCAVRKAEEAIRIARDCIRRQDRQVNPEVFQFAQFVTAFTTFPAQEFPATEVLEWYRLRWQVGLVFQRFKSLAQLGHLPKHDDRSAQPGCTASCWCPADRSCTGRVPVRIPTGGAVGRTAVGVASGS